MNSGWQTKKLGDICDIERGGSPRPIQKFITTDPKGINWIKIGDATASGKYIYSTEEKIRPDGVKHSRMVYEGDFILSNSMSFGRPYIMKTAGCIHDGWLVLHRPKIDPDFLYYALSSDLLFDQFDRLAAGSTVRNLNIGLAKSVDIPYPPPPEQRRIVGILDKAFERIAAAKDNTEKNLRNARVVFDSYVQSTFEERGSGWSEKPLGSLVDFRNGINFTQSSKGETIKIVGVRNFKNNFHAPLDDLDTVTIDGKLDTFDLLKRNDILAVRSNGNVELIGRCLLVGDVSERIAHSGFTIRIRTKSDELLPSYLCHFLKSVGTRKRLIEGGTGTNIKSLNQAMLSVLNIPFPVPSMQKKIVQKLEYLSEKSKRLQSIYESKLAALESLRKSLLNQAFTGNL